MSIRDTVRSFAHYAQAPEGFIDVPYMYGYDASKLTDGNGYQNLSLTLDNDSDFHMRRVVGANLCVNPNATGSFQILDKSQAQFFQSPIRPGIITAPAGNPNNGVISGSWPVAPESVYPAGSNMTFALNGVLRNFTADNPNIYNSQLGFWGIRRFPRSAFWTHKTRYAFHELPYTYQLGVAVNWSHWTNGSGSGVPQAARQFQIPILETDFELCAIGVTYSNGQPVTTNDFQFQLYDPSGSRFLSSSPMNLPYWNFNAPFQYGQPVYPVPSLVWPAKGLILFQITSMLPVGTVHSYVFHFMGVWRARN